MLLLKFNRCSIPSHHHVESDECCYTWKTNPQSQSIVTHPWHNFTILQLSLTMDSPYMVCYSFFIGTHPLCLFCQCCLLQLWIWTGNLQACQRVAECTRHKTKNVARQKPNWHHFSLTDLPRQENQTSPTKSMTWIFHVNLHEGIFKGILTCFEYLHLSSNNKMHLL